MILTCPECGTRYQTDAAHFMPDGRKVRCAKCGHVWFQAAPQPEADVQFVHEEEPPQQQAQHEPEYEEPAKPEPVFAQRAAYAPPETDYEEEEDVATPRPRILERLGYVLGWAALAGILIAVGWSGIHFRQDVASLWPQSSTLYRALGLRVNTRGIAIIKEPARFETENGQVVLLVTGRLANITSHELTVPMIRASLTDDDKRHELCHWVFSPNVPTLKPGQVITFHTRFPNPPAGARNIFLHFAERNN
jgi:predicted Zn finger-like uncharacterized protein